MLYPANAEADLRTGGDPNDMQKKFAGVFSAAMFAVLGVLGGPAQAQTQKPNILVIWGDDIGGFNISAYNRGMMGYRTPNIDSIAAEGWQKTD
jgi:arylsulfatase